MFADKMSGNTFYKNSNHEVLFELFLKRLNSKDVYYTLFAYVASATEKQEVVKALSDHKVDYEVIIDMSKKWSTTERVMLEVAYQLFNDGFLYKDEDDNESPLFSTIHSLFRSLDEANRKIVLEAIKLKYL